MPNIALQPEQIRLVYWISILILGLIVLLSIVKVALDETKEEPNEFVKRHTLFLFLSWCLVGLWFAPTMFPQHFTAITNKSRTRNVQKSNTSRSTPPTPKTQSDKDNSGSDMADSDTDDAVPVDAPKTQEYNTPNQTRSGANSSDNVTMNNATGSSTDMSDRETNDGNDNGNNKNKESGPPVQKEVSPQVMKRIRDDKS